MFHDSLNRCSDTFDENTPPVDDPEYISSLGAAIYGGMQSGDSQAVWLMQVIDSFLKGLSVFEDLFYQSTKLYLSVTVMLKL